MADEKDEREVTADPEPEKPNANNGNASAGNGKKTRQKPLEFVGVPYVPDGDWYTIEEREPGTTEWLKSHVPDVWLGIEKAVRDHEGKGVEARNAPDDELAELTKERNKAIVQAQAARAAQEKKRAKLALVEQKAVVKATTDAANEQVEAIKTETL